MSRQAANAISLELREVPRNDVPRPKTCLDLPRSIRQKHNPRPVNQPEADISYPLVNSPAVTKL